LLAENEKPRYNARLFAHLRKKAGSFEAKSKLKSAGIL